MYLDLIIYIDNSLTTFRQDSYNKIQISTFTGIFFLAISCSLPRTRSGRRPGRRGTRTIVAPGPALLHFLCVYGVYCCVCVCV